MRLLHILCLHSWRDVLTLTTHHHHDHTNWWGPPPLCRCPPRQAETLLAPENLKAKVQLHRAPAAAHDRDQVRLFLGDDLMWTAPYITLKQHWISKSKYLFILKVHLPRLSLAVLHGEPVDLLPRHLEAGGGDLLLWARAQRHGGLLLSLDDTRAWHSKHVWLMGDSADLGLILASLWQYMVIKLTMDGGAMKGHFQDTKYTWCFVFLYFKM